MLEDGLALREALRATMGQDVRQDETQQLQSTLKSIGLSHVYGNLAAFGLDNRSIAQADDDDWEDFGMAVSDGRRVRSAMRAAMGYDPEV